MADLRSRIRSGETLIGVFSDLASPMAVELCGQAGFDWAVLDLEHGAATRAICSLAHAAVAADGSARPRNRLSASGSGGHSTWAPRIMLPQLKSIDDVRTASRTCGIRQSGSAVWHFGRGGGMGSLGHADVARTVNERVVGIVQIESGGTVADADAIAALDEVDVLFVGPADLTHSLGIPGRFDDPRYLEALASVVEASTAHGKAAGILIYDSAGRPAAARWGSGSSASARKAVRVGRC